MRRISTADLWLAAKAAILLALVRCALWILPFPLTRHFVQRVSHPVARLQAHSTSSQRLARMVSLTSHFVPGAAHCLTQALVTQVLLNRRGQPAELCFGIDKSSSEKFVAHAWVESDGQVVIGGPDVGRYIRLRSP